MIYEYPDAAKPVRQGDIFVGLPRIDISLREIPIIGADGETDLLGWREIVETGRPVTAVLGLCPVAGIVATQDCDASRARDITLCEVRRFQEVERKSADTSKPRSWKNLLTQHSRINLNWFYLPPDERIGFEEKMAVDFMVTMRVAREELEELRDLRRGRLNPIADEHFRERTSEFFRRYPYDEWYSLDKEELQAYMHEYPDARPFPWQKTG